MLNSELKDLSFHRISLSVCLALDYFLPIIELHVLFEHRTVVGAVAPLSKLSASMGYESSRCVCARCTILQG